MYNPQLQKKNDKNETKEYLIGQLLVAVSGAIVELPFRYGLVKDRSYVSQIAQMPIDFLAADEKIYTSRIDLSFAKGSRVRLYDNRILTIQQVDNKTNIDKGLRGNILVGYYLTLK